MSSEAWHSDERVALALVAGLPDERHRKFSMSALMAVAQRSIRETTPLVELVPLVVRATKCESLIALRTSDTLLVSERLRVRLPFEKCSHATSVSKRVQLFVLSPCLFSFARELR